MYEIITSYRKIKRAVINPRLSGEHLHPIGYQIQPPIATLHPIYINSVVYICITLKWDSSLLEYCKNYYINHDQV